MLNIFHNLDFVAGQMLDSLLGKRKKRLTRFLKALNSEGVKLSAFPMTGMTLTLGDSLRISSMSSSRSLSRFISLPRGSEAKRKEEEDKRMTSRSNEVQQSVNSVVSKTGVSLDSTLFR